MLMGIVLGQPLGVAASALFQSHLENGWPPLQLLAGVLSPQTSARSPRCESDQTAVDQTANHSIARLHLFQQGFECELFASQLSVLRRGTWQRFELRSDVPLASRSRHRPELRFSFSGRSKRFALPKIFPQK